MKIYTIPTIEQIHAEYHATPGYMRPNTQPSAVVFESLLTDEECDSIIEEQSKLEAYKFNHCDATTTECEHPLSRDLWPILEAVVIANESCFNYDISAESGRAWMQTYVPGGSYQRHMDGSVGQARKLTGVAMLTDPAKYRGGHLSFDIPPYKEMVPSSRGTVVVFPGWLIHEVTTLDSGFRQTINLGVWGSPWK